MTHELDLFGVFIPDLLAWTVVAFLISVPVRRILSVAGVYRAVWHRPLFDIAIFVLILDATVAAAHRVLP